VLAPKFDADGLVTCVATDVLSGDVLMVAHMNAEALARTIESGTAWYYSRSRKRLWQKGETSGHIQRVVEMRIDCDQDAVWIKVEQAGPGACHTGRRSCFYRAVPLGAAAGAITLEFRDGDKLFDPAAIYPDK
jgi:phosphoribosyl-AMP cyclohydrolase